MGEICLFAVMNGYLRRIWVGRGIDKIMQMDKGLYLIRFHFKEDMGLALLKECLQFDNKPMVVQKWSPDFECGKNRAPVVQVWVRFPHLPIQDWGCESLSRLASQLGKPLEMDPMKNSKDQLHFT